jgi:hypothetical protein
MSRKAAKFAKRKHLKDLEVFIMNPVPFFAPLAPLRETVSRKAAKFAKSTETD